MRAMPDSTRSQSWRDVNVKVLVYVLIGIIALLQYPLWLGSGSVFNLWRLERKIAAQQKENAHLQERNAALEAEVTDLKTGLEAVEERARAELGMVKKDEAFYQIIPAPAKSDNKTKAANRPATPPPVPAAPRSVPTAQ